MTEIVRPRSGEPVQLSPCPPWCTQTRHFRDGFAVDVEDGFYHYGPGIAIQTSEQMRLDEPEIVVRVSLASWTASLGAEPGPGRISLGLGTSAYASDIYAELTPDQARVVAGAMLRLADVGSAADKGRAGPET